MADYPFVKGGCKIGLNRWTPRTGNTEERLDKMIIQEKIIYLAGIIDGEGYIGINLQKQKKCNRYRIRLCVCNTNLELLTWLVDNFGGGIYEKRVYKSNHSKSFNWSVGDKSAEEILTVVYPYLIIKKKQAELALAYRKLQNLNRPTYPGLCALPKELRHEIFITIKHLNSCPKSVEANMPNANSLLAKIESELVRNNENRISDNLVAE